MSSKRNISILLVLMACFSASLQLEVQGISYIGATDVLNSVECSNAGGCDLSLFIEDCPSDITTIEVKCDIDIDGVISTHKQEIISFLSRPSEDVIAVRTDFPYLPIDQNAQCYVVHNGEIYEATDGLTINLRNYYTPHFLGLSSHDFGAHQQIGFYQQARQSPSQRPDGECLFESVSIDGYEVKKDLTCQDSNYSWYDRGEFSTFTSGVLPSLDSSPLIKYQVGNAARARYSQIKNWDQSVEYTARVHPTIHSILNICEEPINSQFAAGGNDIILEGYFGEDISKISAKISGVDSPRVEFEDQASAPQKLRVEVPAEPVSVTGNAQVGCAGLTKTLKQSDEFNLDWASEYDESRADVVRVEHVGSFATVNSYDNEDIDFSGNRFCHKLDGWFTVPQTGTYCFISSCDDSCEFFFNTTPDTDFSGQDFATLNANYGLNTLKRTYKGPLYQDFDTYKEYNDAAAADGWDNVCIDLTGDNTHRIAGYACEVSGNDHMNLGFIFQDSTDATHHHRQYQVDKFEIRNPDQTRQVWRHKVYCPADSKFRATFDYTHEDKIFNTDDDISCPPTVNGLRNKYGGGFWELGYGHYAIEVNAVDGEDDTYIIDWILQKSYDPAVIATKLRKITLASRGSGSEFTVSAADGVYADASNWIWTKSTHKIRGDFRLSVTTSAGAVEIDYDLGYNEGTHNILNQIEKANPLLVGKFLVRDDFSLDPLIKHNDDGRQIYFEWFGVDEDVTVAIVSSNLYLDDPEQDPQPSITPSIETLVSRSGKLVYFPIPSFFLNAYVAENIVEVEYDGICSYYFPDSHLNTNDWSWTTDAITIDQTVDASSITITVTDLDGTDDFEIPADYDALFDNISFAGSTVDIDQSTWMTSNEITGTTSHRLAGDWLVEFDTCDGRISNTGSAYEVNLSIDGVYPPNDVGGTEVTEVFDGQTLVFVTTGGPKNLGQANKYGFEATIDGGASIEINRIQDSKIKATLTLPNDGTASFTVTFSVNGKSDTVTLTAGSSTATYNVAADPELNEYEQKDVTITVANIDLSAYSCDSSGPGTINNYGADVANDGLFVQMISTTDATNKRPLRITDCPDGTTLTARYPKAAPGDYTLVITKTASGVKSRIALENGGNNTISVGVVLSSSTPTTGNGSLVTISGSKLPAGGPGLQDGLSEYHAFVGDVEVAITEVDVAGGTIIINIPAGLHENGEQEICITIDIVSINCNTDTLTYTFDDTAAAQDASIVTAFDDNGDVPTFTFTGTGFSTDKSTYSLRISGVPLATEFNLADLITTAEATSVVVQIPYKNDNTQYDITFGPLNGVFVNAVEDATEAITLSSSGPQTDVSAGGATVFIQFKGADYNKAQKFQLVEHGTETRVCVDGTIERTATSFTCRVKAGTTGRLSLISKEAQAAVVFASTSNFSLTEATDSPTISQATLSGTTATVEGTNFGTIKKVFFGGAEATFSGATATQVEVDMSTVGFGEFLFDIEFDTGDANTSNWAVNTDSTLDYAPTGDLGFTSNTDFYCSGGAQLTSSDALIVQAAKGGSATVLVGDNRCAYNPADISTTFSCEVPPLYSQAIYEDTNIPKRDSRILNPFSISADNADEAYNAIDGKLGNNYSTTNDDGHIQIDLVSSTSTNFAAIEEIRYYVNAKQKSVYHNHLVVEGKKDGDWEEIQAITGNVMRENFVHFVGTLYYRQIRFRCTQASACKLGEIVVKGHILSEGAAKVEIWTQGGLYDTGVTVTCDTDVPKVSNIVVSARPDTAYDGNNSILNPLGGETVTFTFDNLQGNTDASIWFGNSANTCGSVANSGLDLSCTSAARDNNVDNTFAFDVIFAGKGRPYYDITDIYYGWLYSDANAWGGTYGPQDDEMIYVGPGQAVLLDKDTPKLAAILIEGGKFIIKDLGEGNTLTMDCSYVLIHKGGLMQAGTPQNRYLGNLLITMHGTIQSAELSQYGNKVIGIRDGTLQFNGRELDHTWVELSTTAPKGQKYIIVNQDVSSQWKVDDEIVIASTDFNSEHAERFHIGSIETHADGAKITFRDKKKLQHKHYAGTYSADTEDGTTHEITMRAEVGLLSRNIVYQGEPEQSQRDQYGAHIMFSLQAEDIDVGNATGALNSAIRVDTGRAVGQISYCEFRFVGQAFQLGRYPIHYHMLGNVADSFVIGNAIHDTYNRAVTFHHVMELRVTDNVAYRTMGHTFFIEDAVEEMNYIERNFGVDSRRSWSLLNTDQTPATFWITNPHNHFIDNRAGGSHRYGYWFDHQVHPVGLSPDACVWVEARPIGTFRGNHAHSNGRYGVRVFHNWVPVKFADGFVHCDAGAGDFKGLLGSQWGKEDADGNPIMTPVPAILEDIVSYKNGRNGIIFEFTGDIQVKNAKVADNVLAGIEYSLMHHELVVDGDYDAHVKDSTVFGHTDNFTGDLELFLQKGMRNNNGTPAWEKKRERVQAETGLRDEAFGALADWNLYIRCLILPRTEHFIVDGLNCVAFDNVTGSGQNVEFGAIGSCSHCFHPAATDQGARKAQFKNFHITDGAIRFAWQVPHTAILEDIGSPLTLAGDTTANYKWVTPYFQHNDFTRETEKHCIRGSVPVHSQFAADEVETIDGVDYFTFDPSDAWGIKQKTRFLMCKDTVELARIIITGQQPFANFRGMEMKVTRITDILQDFDAITTRLEEKFDEDADRYHSVVLFKEKTNPGNAWTVPFVTGQAYNVHWRYGMTFESMEFWRQNDQWDDMQKGLMLQFNRTGLFLEAIESKFLDGEDENPVTLNAAEMPTGPDVIADFPLTSRPDWATELTVAKDSQTILNGQTFNDYENEVTQLWIAPGPAAGSSQKIRVNQLRCASFATCNPGLFGGDREGIWRRWSETEQKDQGWEQAGEPNENYPVDQTDITNDKIILPAWQMEYDVDSAIVESLSIEGVLKVKAGNRSLTANRILIGRYGELRVGTEAEPFTDNFNLVITGNMDSRHLTGNPDVDIGNKGIANFGLLSVHGAPRSGHKAKLLESFAAEGTVVKVDKDIAADWTTGDRIGVGPTGFNFAEYEEFEITDAPTINGNIAEIPVARVDYEIQTTGGAYDLTNGDFIPTADLPDPVPDHYQQFNEVFARTVSNEGANHFHYGAATNEDSDYYGLDVRAEVVLLTRNVKIIATEEDRLGLNIVTTEEVTEDAQTGDAIIYKGTAKFTNVEFVNVGHADTQRAGVRFDRIKHYQPINPLQTRLQVNNDDHQTLPHTRSVIRDCSFNRGFGFAINVEFVDAYNGLYIWGNTVFGVAQIGIQITNSNNIWLHKNWVIGVTDRKFETVHNKITDFLAGITACGRQDTSGFDRCQGNKYTQNVVSGVAEHGIIAYFNKFSADAVQAMIDGTAPALNEVYKTVDDENIYLNDDEYYPYSTGDVTIYTAEVDEEFNLVADENYTAQTAVDQEGIWFFVDNETKSSQYGIIWQPNDGASSDYAVSGYNKAAKHSIAAQASFAGSFQEMVYTNALTGYSTYGISMTIGAGSAKQTVLLDSTFVGDMSATDEPGTNPRGITGMMAPSGANNGKKWTLSATQKPWYKIKGNSKMDQRHYAYRLTFNNFPEGNFKLLGQNPTNSDIVPPVEIDTVTLSNVHQDNIAFLKGWLWGKATIDNCGNYPCTGPDNHIFALKSITDDNVNTPFSSETAEGFQVLNVNRTAGLHISSCEPQATWGPDLDDVASEFYTKKGESVPAGLTDEQKDIFIKPHLCQNNNIDLLICDSRDGDRMDRMVTPITVTGDDADAPFKAVLNTFEDHVWDGFYTGQVRQSTFPVAVETTKTSDIQAELEEDKVQPQNYIWNFTGTPPGALDFYFTRNENYGSTPEGRGVVVTIDYPKAGKYTVDCGGSSTLIQMDEEEARSLADQATLDSGDFELMAQALPLLEKGEYRWLAVKNVLQFYQTNEATCEVRYVNSLQLSVRLDIQMSDFWSDTYQTTSFKNRFAASINVQPWQINILGYTTGSVIVIFEIVGDGTSSDNQVENLENIKAEIEAKIASGEIDLGAPILDFTIEAAFEDKYLVAVETEEPSELSLVTIILIALASVMTIIALVLLFICLKRRSDQKQVTLADGEDDPEKFAAKEKHDSGMGLGKDDLSEYPDAVFVGKSARQDSNDKF